jgi:hypothetical protein
LPQRRRQGAKIRARAKANKIKRQGKEKEEEEEEKGEEKKRKTQARGNKSPSVSLFAFQTRVTHRGRCTHSAASISLTDAESPETSHPTVAAAAAATETHARCASSRPDTVGAIGKRRKRSPALGKQEPRGKESGGEGD